MQTTKVVLVTGTPGVGKTTVAHKLASKLNAAYVGITELVKKQKLYISVDEERQTLIAVKKAEYVMKCVANYRSLKPLVNIKTRRKFD